MSKGKPSQISLVLRQLNDSRNELKTRAEKGDKKAAEQLATLRNIDKLRKRYNRARNDYEAAKQLLLKVGVLEHTSL
jgi:hypothetical protein